MGSFFLIDPISHRPAVAGMIDVSLRRATNIHWQRSAVGKSVRARLKQQRPCMLWFTGLSGAGKSMIAISSRGGRPRSGRTPHGSTATISVTASTVSSPGRTVQKSEAMPLVSQSP